MGEVIAAIVAVVAALGGAGTAIQLVLTVASVLYSTGKARDQKRAAAKAQKRARMQQEQRNSFRNFRQPLAARRIVYGRCRVAGPFIFAHNPNDGTTAHLVVALAAHEIDGFEKFHILQDEVPVVVTPGPAFGRVGGKYTRNVIIWPYTGAPGQDIGARMRTAVDVRPGVTGRDLSLDIITADDRFAGIAALYVVTERFGADLEGAQPEFAATIRGKKLLDPRTGLTVWSENPALAAYDYLVNYMAFPPATIHLPTLIAAADTCDQLVPLAAGGTHRRYTISGVIIADDEHRENLDILADTMAGHIRYASGTWFIEAGAPRTPVAGIHFHASQLLAPYDLSLERPARALPNAVRGNFYDEETSQPTSFPQYITPGAPTSALDWLDLELPLVKDHVQAQRIARIRLHEARTRLALNLQLDLRGLLVRPGDVFLFTDPDLGLTAQPLLLEEFTLGYDDLGNGLVLTTSLDVTGYQPPPAWNPATDEQTLQRGTVNLASITGTAPAFPLTYTQATRRAGDFDADYLFEWYSPLHAPADGMPASVTFSLTLRFEVYAGGRTITSTTVTRTITVPYTTNGSIILPFRHPISGTLQTYTIRGAFAQLTYPSGTLSAPITPTYIG